MTKQPLGTWIRGWRWVQPETSWEMLETAPASALTRARSQGELADKDPRVLAASCLSCSRACA
jgi:hypothetical protein